MTDRTYTHDELQAAWREHLGLMIVENVDQLRLRLPRAGKYRKGEKSA